MAAPMTTVAHDSLANFRDLGGLPTDDGVRTRSGVLYRSDAPLAGDTAPAAPVWPPAVVVDLRSADEPVDPHSLAIGDTVVRRLPLMAEARPGTFHALRAKGELSLGGLYAAMVDRTAAILPDVLALLLSTDGPALIHCTAGKDRTGVVCAVLLRAAGVAREAVVEDYVRTTTNMDRVRPRMPALDQQVSALSAGFTTGDEAPGAAIAAALDLVERTGDIRDWLDTAGVGADRRAQWRHRLVG
jgi:protein-tyrosine phosphatase